MKVPFAFRPKLVDALQGYQRHDLTADLIAGLTVGIVALPLAMAFAIASAVKPEAGIFTAVIAGFLISALGGTNVAIGGQRAQEVLNSPAMNGSRLDGAAARTENRAAKMEK